MIAQLHAMAKTQLISVAWIMMLIVFNSFEDVSSMCQRLISIEKGQNTTVGCNTTESRTDTFWYIGSPSSTKPILSLVNNRKSGTMYGDDRFDINSEGNMLIFNAQVEDEATYTVVMYFTAGNFQQENITVEIRVYPQQRCPEIAGCTPCSNCSLQINQTGELICSVTGSRPKLSLQWEISSVNHLQLTSYESQSEKDDDTGTWDSYISAQYLFSKCGAFADIRCRVEDNQHLIDQFYSTILVSSDPCPTDKPDSPVLNMFQQSKVIILVVVCLFLILTVSLILIVMTIKRNRGGNNKLQTFVSFLSERYKQHCYITLFADEKVKIVPIDALYVDCQCIVKWNNRYQIMSTDEVMFHKDIQGEKSVILTGDLGLGKTTFFRHMINKWTQQNDKIPVLIYIQLNENNYQKNIIDIIMDEITSLHREDIKSILLNESVVVLVDGLSELPLPKDCNDISTHYSELLGRLFSVHLHTVMKRSKVREGNTEDEPLREELELINSSANEKNDDVRIRNKEMRTWIALRQTHITLSQMSVKIELVGFNEKQIYELETKMHSYRLVCFDDQPSTEQNSNMNIVFNGDELKIDLKDSQNVPKEETLSPYTSVKDAYNTNECDIEKETFSAHTSVKEADIRKQSNFERKKDSLIRYMYMIKDFPNVPIFFSTLSYNYVFEFRRETADLPRAMTKIVNTIIDCIEGHYNIKQHDVTDKTREIPLRREIDNDFLEKLSENISKSVTELKVILGEYKLVKALAIGLLRARNDVNDLLTFRYPLLERPFREYYLLKEVESETFLLDYETLYSDHFRLPFMHVCGLKDEDLISKALKTLREKGMWDDFIDCFSELKDNQKRISQIERMKKYEEITVTGLDDMYHQDNLKAFVLECHKVYVNAIAKTTNFKGTLILEGHFRVANLTKLMLSCFVRIVFSNVKIEDNDIDFIVEWMLQTSTISSKHISRTFQFHNCTMNLATVGKALKCNAGLMEFYIEITSGSSWKENDSKQTYSKKYFIATQQ